MGLKLEFEPAGATARRVTQTRGVVLMYMLYLYIHTYGLGEACCVKCVCIKFVGIHFSHISTLCAKIAKNRVGHPFFETFFNGTGIFFHWVLPVSREPYAFIDTSILY